MKFKLTLDVIPENPESFQSHASVDLLVENGVVIVDSTVVSALLKTLGFKYKEV